MKIEVRLDPEYAEPKLLILADSMSEEVERILRLLRSEPGRPLVGFRREGASPLEEGGISRIYAQQGRVCLLYTSWCLIYPHSVWGSSLFASVRKSPCR